MRRSVRLALFTSTPLWMMAVSGAALADAAADGTSAIIVTGTRETALKRQTPTASRLGITALETPATVSTVEGDEIQARGDREFMDAVTRAPGVTAAGSPGNGNTSLSLRGFSGPGSVMQLYNGVRLFPTAGTITFPFDTWNIDRIEVLNGPASVLYGQGALGGVVNVIPKSPGFNRWTVEGLAGFGSFNTAQLAAGVSGPVSETVAIRADASYRRSDGYVDRGDSRSLALSGVVEFRLAENLSLTLRHDFGDNQPMEYWGTPLANGTTLDPSIRKRNYNVGDAVIEWRDNRTQLSIDWAATDNVQVTNTTYRLGSRRRWENLESYSYNPTAQTVSRSDNLGIVHDMVQWGNQTNLSLSTPLAGSIHNTLVVGGDLNWVDLKYYHSFSSAPQSDTIPAKTFNPGTFLDTVGIRPRYRTDTRAWAAYLEDRVEFNDRFSIIGGMRYEQDRVGRWNYLYDITGTAITGEVPALAGGTRAYKHFDHFTWRIGGVYEPAKDLSLYAQYVTGVDPVGTLTTFTTSGAQFGFSNPMGNMVEAGVKRAFANGGGFVTIAAYRTVKNDLTVQRVTNGPLEQIGQQSSTGIEASLSANLPLGLGLDANATVLNAEYDSFASGPVDYTGNTPLNVPEASANLTLRWDASDRLQLRSNLRWTGKRFADNANNLTIPSFTVVDLGASFALTDKLALDTRVSNIFDKNYALSAYGSQQWVLGRPRSVDVTLRAAF